MKEKNLKLIENINQLLGDEIIKSYTSLDNVTIEVNHNNLLNVCKKLRDEKIFDFAQLVDLAGVDYYSYAHEEWETKKVTTSGFSRGRNFKDKKKY